jgi:transposase-like protein
VPDLIDSVRADIEQRLNEIRPLVAEVERLERALAALDGSVSEAPLAPGGARTRSGRPAAGEAERSATRPGRRGRRRRGEPSRGDEFLATVRKRPGVTIAEAAREMGIAPNYLYRLAATLEREGTVEREGRGFTAPGRTGVAAPPPLDSPSIEAVDEVAGAALVVVEPDTAEDAERAVPEDEPADEGLVLEAAAEEPEDAPA